MSFDPKQLQAPWPHYSQEEIEAVLRVLQSGRVNAWTGSDIDEFNQAFAAYCQARYAIAVNNGTVALELAIEALGIGAGDLVLVTPRSFFASASAIVRCGARPLFVDVDRETQNISPDAVQNCLDQLRKKGEEGQVKALIAVHLGGWPCDMQALSKICREHGLWLIEDCAQAHGARYQGQPVGALGDVAAWSFCQDKIMSTGGEGGMITTNNQALYEKIWSLKDHGKDYALVHNPQQEANAQAGFRWLHSRFGTNARMTGPQAAMGLVQLARLEAQNKQRTLIAQELDYMLEPLLGEGKLLRAPRYGCAKNCCAAGKACACRHAWYRYTVFVQKENLPKGHDRDSLVAYFNAQGIPCQQGSCGEIYNEKAFDHLNVRPQEPLVNAKELFETSLTFKVHPGLSYQHCQLKALQGLL